tara:strand:- start:5940 stop:6980 length:1041 start_codon:yes stop_codon:yes gene_type:complete
MTTYRKTMTEMYQQVRERTLTPNELKRREEIAKDLPLKDFEKRYGKEKGMQVKMAVATKMAKKETNESRYVQALPPKEAIVARIAQLMKRKNPDPLQARIEVGNFIELKAPALFKYYRELQKKGITKGPEVKKFDKQLMKALEKKYGKDSSKGVEKALKEELNEDGHSDVPSMIRKCKTVIEDANEIMSKLNSMDKEGSLPTWWTNKLAVASNSMNKMRDYILNPIEESVIMEKEGDLEDMKKVVEELKGASKKHLSQAVRIDKLDLENKTLDTICDELRAASKMHLGQSKRVQSHIGMMEGDATDAAKELINREKERMKDKHDTIMQRAKIKDVTDASREKQGEN